MMQKNQQQKIFTVILHYLHLTCFGFTYRQLKLKEFMLALLGLHCLHRSAKAKRKKTMLDFSPKKPDSFCSTLTLKLGRRQQESKHRDGVIFPQGGKNSFRPIRMARNGLE